MIGKERKIYDSNTSLSDIDGYPDCDSYAVIGLYPDKAPECIWICDSLGEANDKVTWHCDLEWEYERIVVVPLKPKIAL